MPGRLVGPDFLRSPTVVSSRVEFYPLAWTCQLNDSGHAVWSERSDRVLVGLAAMSEATADDTLVLRVNGRVCGSYSPLHLAHLWPECLLGKPIVGMGVVADHRDEVMLYGPPRAVVVSYWLVRRELR